MKKFIIVSTILFSTTGVGSHNPHPSEFKDYQTIPEAMMEIRNIRHIQLMQNKEYRYLFSLYSEYTMKGDKKRAELVKLCTNIWSVDLKEAIRCIYRGI